jgi:hypothetical protein
LYFPVSLRPFCHQQPLDHPHPLLHLAGQLDSHNLPFPALLVLPQHRLHSRSRGYLCFGFSSGTFPGFFLLSHIDLSLSCDIDREILTNTI